MKRSASEMSSDARRHVVTLSVDDVRAVRGTIGMQRGARRATKGNSISMGGFDSLVNTLMADEFRRVEAERHGQWRYAAVIGDTVKYERPDPSADTPSCTICFDAPLDPNAVAVPCGHRFSCASCIRTITDDDATCVICREPIERYGTAADVEKVFEAGVDVGAPLTTIEFTVRGDSTRKFVDAVALIRSEDDVRAVLKAYICGKDGAQDDDATWAPVSLSDLAAHAPSLYWSLHALATATTSDGDADAAAAADEIKSTEERMMATQCRLLGVACSGRSGGRRRRAAH